MKRYAQLKKMKSELTVQQLKSVLTYNPSSGYFVWTQNASPGLVGKIAGNLLNGYRVIEIHGGSYAAHRLAWLYVYSEWPGAIDHINGDRDDNRIANLRKATASQNAANMNKPERNTSGLKGVQSLPNGKFAASITCQGKHHSLGRYDTKEEASAAYLVAAKRLFGEFAHDGERPDAPLYKIKAGPLHPLRFKWGNEDPRLQPLTPDQPVIDRLALNPRAVRKLRAIAREKEHESFVQAELKKLEEKTRRR